MHDSVLPEESERQIAFFARAKLTKSSPDEWDLLNATTAASEGCED